MQEKLIDTPLILWLQLVMGLRWLIELEPELAIWSFINFTLLFYIITRLNNFLISEAVRGEGGILKNPETGERFMKRYAPEQLELATTRCGCSRNF